jgi:hypothetical protein
MEGEGEQEAPKQLDAAVLLQIGTTIAAIAVALATLGEDDGPTLGDDLHIVPAAFLFVGLVAIYASLFALSAIWVAAGMRFSDDILAGNADAHPDLAPFTYQALVAVTWSMWFLTIVYVALLFTSAF